MGFAAALHGSDRQVTSPCSFRHDPSTPELDASVKLQPSAYCHTVDYDPLIRSLLASTQLTCGPYVFNFLQIWRERLSKFGGNETPVVHLVGFSDLLKLKWSSV